MLDFTLCGEVCDIGFDNNNQWLQKFSSRESRRDSKHSLCHGTIFFLKKSLPNSTDC